MPYLIAYWSEHRDVLWTDGDNKTNKYDTLFGRMQALICEGHISEVLEYVPKANDSYFPVERCDYWRAVLHDQGYDIDGYHDEGAEE
jgi:hypothetical protein